MRMQSTAPVGAELRGSVLREDFQLRGRVANVELECIAEPIFASRSAAAHGFFTAYEALADLTCAAPFAEAGKLTPVFVRFSSLAGEYGAAGSLREARGFAVKFFTGQGSWDLLGSNLPVLCSPAPTAVAAHDAFWDSASRSPETLHMLTWLMSDHALPRSYRMMQGFGVQTFRLTNACGVSQFVKFHWRPLLGTHALGWDEAVAIAGVDADFHRRDLWEAIESGDYPAWELGMQLFSAEQAEAFGVDVFDATQLIPEELVPLRPVGRLLLNRNPDKFFADTEQPSCCPTQLLPGIALATAARRGKSEQCGDPYTQTSLFYNSQTELERAHIAGGFCTELSKLTRPAIRQRMLASLANVSRRLAAAVADGLGMAMPMQLPLLRPEIRFSAALSLSFLPGDGSIRTRKVALLAAHGVDGASLLATQRALQAAGAVCVVIATRPGAIEAADGDLIQATASFTNSPPALFDAVVLPAGEAGVKSLLCHGQSVDFVAQQFRQGKTLLALGASKALLDRAGADAFLITGEADPGVLLAEAEGAHAVHAAFIAAIGRHRHSSRV